MSGEQIAKHLSERALTAAAQVAPEHWRWHVAMCESRIGHTAPSEVPVDYEFQSIMVKNVENGEKSPERVDIVGFKLYIRYVRTRLYRWFSKY